MTVDSAEQRQSIVRAIDFAKGRKIRFDPSSDI
jgi:hypothetical protein